MGVWDWVGYKWVGILWYALQEWVGFWGCLCCLPILVKFSWRLLILGGGARTFYDVWRRVIASDREMFTCISAPAMSTAFIDFCMLCHVFPLTLIGWKRETAEAQSLYEACGSSGHVIYLGMDRRNVWDVLTAEWLRLVVWLWFYFRSVSLLSVTSFSSPIFWWDI
jgi:hypothetical protein